MNCAKVFSEMRGVPSQPTDSLSLSNSLRRCGDRQRRQKVSVARARAIPDLLLSSR
jgi:hypothetical protein